MHFTEAGLANALHFLQNWLRYRFTHDELGGCSIALRMNNKEVFARTFGMANIEKSNPLLMSHYFNAASQTKMLTAAAILMLQEQKKLQIYQPVYKVLPWLVRNKDPFIKNMRFCHVLSHSAGLIRDGFADHWRAERAGPTNHELQTLLITEPLQFEPGTSVKYSNLGFALLGMAIEKITGESYCNFITKHILEVLKINECFMGYYEAIGKYIPQAYGIKNYKQYAILPSPHQPNSFQASASLYGTPSGLARLVEALIIHKNKVLSGASQAQMCKVQSHLLDGFDKGAKFGFGIEYSNLAGQTVFGHSGHAAGNTSVTYIDMNNSIVISVATNMRTVSARDIAMGVFSALKFYLCDQPRERTSKYEAFLRTSVSSIAIADNGQQVVMVDPENWQPFQFHEQLEESSATSFKIITPGSLYNYGESVQYHFSNKDIIQKVVIAGATFLPELEI